ncbi:hypothetical protein ACIBCM_11300 [Streptomyces sp. NPDC051018]|uniref:hypothetical protein n=1 Tax=Streptomyces sp. NPDC051018 TaxID=3365639 RepID=UPI0037BD0889
MDQQQTPRPGRPGDERIVCSLCQKVAEGPPPTWTCSMENGSRRYLCDDCARANIRAIESRLDSSWW